MTSLGHSPHDSPSRTDRKDDTHEPPQTARRRSCRRTPLCAAQFRRPRSSPKGQHIRHPASRLPCRTPADQKCRRQTRRRTAFCPPRTASRHPPRAGTCRRRGHYPRRAHCIRGADARLPPRAQPEAQTHRHAQRTRPCLLRRGRARGHPARRRARTGVQGNGLLRLRRRRRLAAEQLLRTWRNGERSKGALLPRHAHRRTRTHPAPPRLRKHNSAEKPHRRPAL